MAEALNDVFVSVFTKKVGGVWMPNTGKASENGVGSDAEIGKEQVKNDLDKFDVFKSPGPDETRPGTMKELTEEISEAFASIFEKSWKTGEIPEDWKRAHIVLIYKKRNKGNPGNYRPVSLTSVPGKIMEQIIKESICKHLEDNKVISNSQHGFVRNKSCQTNLIAFSDKVTSLVDSGEAVDVVYLDFSKAFDTVLNDLLINKLGKYNLDGAIIRWVHNWLDKHSQRVVINGSQSCWKGITSGVPQGSVLGPVLLTVFINDVDHDIERTIIKFVDDTKLGRVASALEDRMKIQNDLDKLEKWSEVNRMKFNKDKCKVCHLGRNNQLHTYNMGNDRLGRSNLLKHMVRKPSTSSRMLPLPGGRFLADRSSQPAHFCPSVIIPPVGDLAAPETPAPISCFPITMKASLAVFILAALLATGACLQCEVCEGPGTNCTGDLETCAAGLDSCGITLTESTLAGMKLQMIAKGCVTSGSCKVGPFTMNFGNGVTMKVITACCVGVACRTTTVTAPPADPKPSGRSCPACIAVLFAKCNEEIIDCTGAETRCVEVAGTTTIGEIVTSLTLKGCATEAFCANKGEGSGSFAGVHVDLTLKCKAPGTARGPAGLLIPALAGLLLMPLLS
ncbi:unnamed protein product [Natator depressus]